MLKKFLLTVFMICLVINFGFSEEFPSIESIMLTGEWKFKPDYNNVGFNEKWYTENMDDSYWELINVPGTWNEGQNVSVEWNYEGVAWYRRKFDIPMDWEGKNIKLKFLAVYLIADVWINGEYLGNHKGGYTAFSFDVSSLLKSNNTLAVRVDNTKRPYQVPGASIDWWNCGGITREVFLEKHPEISLKKMHITPSDINNKSAIVNVDISIENKLKKEKKLDIRAEVLYENKIISASEEKTITIKDNGNYRLAVKVQEPELWSPDEPNLYLLKFYWKLHENNDWWTFQDRFGIRKIETKGTKLYLNGKEIWLQGIAFHQDYEGMGSAVTLSAQRSDLERIKRLNANFVRLGHYPFHPYSLEVCDEIGLLVWSEIPVWQNSREELANEQMWQEWVKPHLDEMIDQLYNHPSIIFWSVANEISQTWRGEREADEIVNYIKRSTEYVRKKDSTRLVSYASAASTGGGTWQYLDVNGKPLHYGWFHSPNVYDIGPEVDLVHSLMPDQPILAVELCGMSYPDNHRGYSEDERFSVEYHDKLLRVDMQHLMIRKDFVCGVTLWTLADLKGGREKGTYGILSRDRKQVKHIYETIKNLYSKDPKLLIIDSKTGYKPGEKLEVELWSFNRTDKSFKGCSVQWWITGSNGKMTEGQFSMDIKPNKAEKIGTVTWDIPETESGFHSMLCTMKDSNRELLFVNDYYFDVGQPSAPCILWVKVTDKNENPLSNKNVQIEGFTRVTDEFGRVPFLLNTGKYKVKVENMELSAEVGSGETNEILFILE